MKKQTWLELYSEALALLQKHPDNNGCIRNAHIAGWNYALDATPALATGMWNLLLPKSLRIGHETFVDKGITPEPLTLDEKVQLAHAMGLGTEDGDKNFDPFWQWRGMHPQLSNVEAKRRIEALQKEAEKRQTTMKNIYMESEIS